MQAQETYEADFGQGRRGEAQLAMRVVLRLVESEAYRGSRLKEGELLPEFDDAESAATYYSAALIGYLQGLGADVRIEPSAEELADITAHQTVGVPGDAAPFETVVISGTVPGNAILGGKKAQAQIIEACAEMIRVLVGTALVAAYEDAGAQEQVVVYFKRLPEFLGSVDLAQGGMAGIGRVSAIVYCEETPQASYLLGAAHGMAKPHQLVWDFPLVEQIYGQDRLRWNDRRSPGYVAEVQKPVVAS